MGAFDVTVVYGGSAVLVQQDQMSIWVMKYRVLCVSAVLQRIVRTGERNLFLKDSIVNYRLHQLNGRLLTYCI